MEHITLNGKDYEVIRLLGRGKGGYSYLVQKDGEEFVLKQIHHEPCDYYTFGDKLAAEKNDYLRLLPTRILMPKLLEIDFEAERILKEYIEGPTAEELVKTGALKESHLQQVRQMAAQAKAADLNIDYYPTNFILNGDQLYYIDFECNDFMEEWSFETWGKQYWQIK